LNELLCDGWQRRRIDTGALVGLVEQERASGNQTVAGLNSIAKAVLATPQSAALRHRVAPLL
jgi:hypothetical protein